MIFSVFDPYRRTYDYYDAPGTSVDYGARGTKFRALTQSPQGPTAASMGLAGAPGDRVAIGFAPEALAMPLPSSARKTGSGNVAKGIVAALRVGPREPDAVIPSDGALSVSGLGSVGDDGVGDGVPPPPVAPPTVPFGQMLAATCVAAVVGVMVQRALK